MVSLDGDEWPFVIYESFGSPHPTQTYPTSLLILVPLPRAPVLKLLLLLWTFIPTMVFGSEIHENEIIPGFLSEFPVCSLFSL